MNLKPLLFLLSMTLGLLISPGASTGNAQADGLFSGKKILFVDSYHSGYPWSDGVENGIRTGLATSGVELKILRMDTKRNTSQEFKRAAGEEALKIIQAYQPDVIIASDDNAQKYLVAPYLLGKDIPVVFCGVNWDASAYGYPAGNVTGMLEVEGVNELIALFKRDAKGPRIGYISGDTVSDRKITKVFNERFLNNRMKIYFAKDFEEFKAKFLQAQAETDMLFLRNYSGIQGWEEKKAKAFLLENVKKPTGSHLSFMAEYVIYTIGKIPEEQGEYAAKTALRILGGENPADIPLARNTRVRLVVNLKMAKAAGVVVPFKVLKTATVIGKD